MIKPNNTVCINGKSMSETKAVAKGLMCGICAHEGHAIGTSCGVLWSQLWDSKEIAPQRCECVGNDRRAKRQAA